jgi:hypothetical protein
MHWLGFALTATAHKLGKRKQKYPTEGSGPCTIGVCGKCLKMPLIRIGAHVDAVGTCGAPARAGTLRSSCTAACHRRPTKRCPSTRPSRRSSRLRYGSLGRSSSCNAYEVPTRYQGLTWPCFVQAELTAKQRLESATLHRRHESAWDSQAAARGVAAAYPVSVVEGMLLVLWIGYGA